MSERIDELTEYFLNYSEQLDGHPTPPDLRALELEMHEGPEDEKQGLHGWAVDHEERYPGFSVLDLNLRKYRWQQLTINTAPASRLSYVLPRRLLVPKMRRTFVKTIGPKARNALAEYDNTPADPNVLIEEGGVSVSQAIGSIIAKKESIIVLVSHAESLDDVAVNQGPVAISAASARSRFIRKVGTSLSKTLTREKYKGKPVLKHFSFFGKVYLTFPDTANTTRWRIPEEAKKIVVGGSTRELYRDIEDGLAMVVAPTGTGMLKNPQTPDGQPAEGPKSLHLPEFPENMPRLIGRFGHYLISATWGDNVSVSSIYDLPDFKSLESRGKKLSKEERGAALAKHIAHIRQELAQRTADAAQVPVTYLITAEDGAPIKRTALPARK